MSKLTIYVTPAQWERLMASWSGGPSPCIRLEHEFDVRAEFARLSADVKETSHPMGIAVSVPTLEGLGDVSRLTMHVTPPQLERLSAWSAPGAAAGGERAPWLHFSCESFPSGRA